MVPHVRALAAAAALAALIPLATTAPASAAVPGNDARLAAADVGALPATVPGTTVEATLEPDEPATGCGLSVKNTVWYSFTPAATRSVVLALDAAGDMDAVIDLYTRERSQLLAVDCAPTDRRGLATLDFDALGGTQYLVRVSARFESVADRFTLRVVAPEAPERAPGSPLPAGGVADSVDRLADPDDAWSVRLTAGRPYRMNLVSKDGGCVNATVYLPGSGFGDQVRSRSCDAHSVFVAERTGRYAIQVLAPRRSRTTLPYRLKVGPARADDIAPGVRLPADTTVAGRLVGDELDALDLYRFSVPSRADVRIRLRSRADFRLLVLDAVGRTIGSSRGSVELRLRPGRYFAAVTAVDGAVGRYTLRRHSRVITSATTSVDGRRQAAVSPGRSVTLGISVSRAASGPAVLVVQRFDPLDGWLFAARYRVTVTAGQAAVSFQPSGVGRWRVTGLFEGTRAYSPSFGGTATWQVVEPLE